MFEQIIKEIKEQVGDTLMSVVRFGSEGEPNNLLVVLKKLDFDVLNRIKPSMIKHRKRGNAVPLLFTEKELRDGVDVFPLEFLDIKHPHMTLYGKEVIDKIRFNKRSVRRQLEFELRSKLIHLRENYLWIHSRKELENILKAAVPSLMPLFYGLLFLKDIKAPARLDELFRVVSQEYTVDFSILRKINQAKEGKRKLARDELRRSMRELMALLADLGEIVDEM